MTQSFYDYDPSVTAAVVFAILYTATAGTTTFQYFWYRCWFWLFMVIASLMESVGYIARIISVKNVSSKPPFVVQFLLVFLAPSLIAASCYMAMGRIVMYVTPVSFRTVKNLWVAPRWMTPIFVTFDVISFLIQVFGGVSSVSDNATTAQNGFKIMKLGLIVQLIAFGFFIIVSFRFHSFSRKFRDQWPDVEWVRLLWVINIACVLIFIRSIYRFIEFSQGKGGYLDDHEWNYYVFEAALMLPVLVVFNIFHPAKFLSNVGWKQNSESKRSRGMRRIGDDSMEML